MLTAKGQADDVVAAFQAGADDYVVKPFDKDILKSRVAVGTRIVAFEEALTQSHQRLSEQSEQIAHDIDVCATHISDHVERLRQCWSDLQSMLTLMEPGKSEVFLRDIPKAIEGLSHEGMNISQIIAGFSERVLR